ncbi:hypothetical protein [Actinomadura sp. WMMA1423]|uniref:hypothetical protein n=1 Tax=Actinomadura sp. WMMA1423 TaxID=2591108 RepID=UPI00114714A0|nr:hypothetical protein [Actinomadura sp. WMMA1423]
MALFVVGGLVFSYGLGHVPPQRICTQHAVSVPVGAASTSSGHGQPGAAAFALQGSHGPAEAASAASPIKAPDPVPMHACLCLAVLFILVLLGLAAGLRRPLSRTPARLGWALSPPPGARLLPASQPSLQVLRL